MLNRILLALSFSFAALGYAATDSEHHVHVICDFDDVLFLSVPKTDAEKRGIHGFEFDGRVYYPREGASEFISSLLKIPQLDIVIYSAGKEENVRSLLSHLNVVNAEGKTVTANQVMTRILGENEVLRPTREDPDRLIPLQPELPPFRAGKQKKDLTRIVPASDLANTVLIDDHVGNVVRGQEKSLLWAKPQDTYFKVDDSLTPLLDQKLLPRMRALLERAIQFSRKSGRKLSDTLFDMQWDLDGDHYAYKLENYFDLKLYKEGEALLGMKSPEVEKLSQTRLLPLSAQLADDRSKVTELFYVRKFLPDLFSQGAQFDFSPLQVMDGEGQLLKNLERNKEYEAQLGRPKKYQNLEITDPAARTRKIRGLAFLADKIPAFGASMQLTLNGLSRAADPKAEIVARIRHLSGELHGRSTQEVSAEFVKLLNPEQRTAAFKANDLETRLKIIEKVDDRPVPSRLIEINGWPSGFRIKDAMSEIRRLKDVEDELGRLHLAWAILDSEGSLDLRNVPIEDLNSITDPVTLRDHLANVSAAAEDGTFRLPTKDQLNWVNGAMAPYASRVDKEVSDGFNLKLLEVPPDVSAFRGCAAGNCETQKEFAISNDPHERVFFIYPSGSNSPIGVLKGTSVISEKNPAFYVNTLNGPKMGVRETSLILRALGPMKDHLGVSEILFADPKNFYKMFNNKTIADEVLRSVDATHLHPVTFQNPRIREQIETFKHPYNTATYDQMVENLNGVLFKGFPDGTPPKVRSSEAQFPDWDFPRLDHADAVGVAMDFWFSGRRKELARIAKYLSVDLEKLQPLFESVENKEKLMAGDYLKSLDTVFEKAGLPSTLLSSRKSLLRRGWLQSSDALSTMNFATTINYFGKEIKGKVVYPGLVAFAQEHWERLIENDEVRKTILKGLLGTYDDLVRINKIIPPRAGSLPNAMKEEVIKRLADHTVKAEIMRDFANFSNPTDPHAPDDSLAEIVVKALYDSSDPEVQGDAGGILLKFEPKTEFILNEIRKAAQDPRVPMASRQALLTYLGRTSPKEAAAILQATFERPEPQEKQLFAIAAGNVADPSVGALVQKAYDREAPPKGDVKIRKSLLIALMSQVKTHPELKSTILLAREDDPLIRKQFISLAIQANSKDPQWLQPVLQMKNDPNREVRMGLASELGNRLTGNPEALAVLRELASDPDVQVRETAKLKLAVIGSPVNQCVVETLELKLGGH